MTEKLPPRMIYMMSAGLDQTINGNPQEIRMCVVAQPGTCEFTGPVEKAIYLEEHDAIVKPLVEALEAIADQPNEMGLSADAAEDEHKACWEKARHALDAYGKAGVK